MLYKDLSYSSQSSSTMWLLPIWPELYNVESIFIFFAIVCFLCDTYFILYACKDVSGLSGDSIKLSLWKILGLILQNSVSDRQWCTQVSSVKSESSPKSPDSSRKSSRKSLGSTFKSVSSLPVEMSRVALAICLTVSLLNQATGTRGHFHQIESN